jgi:ABC-type multidrug transport system fused ATPase/permease subunit
MFPQESMMTGFTVRQTLAVSYRLLSPTERRKAIVIVAFSFWGGATDIISLMAVYPLISILVQPDLVQTNAYIRMFWEIAGSPSVSLFAIMLATAASLIIVIGSTLNILSQVQANRFAASCQERLGRDLMMGLLQAPYFWHLQRNPLLLGSLFQAYIVSWSRDVIRRIATMAGQLAAIVLPASALIGWSPLIGSMIIISAVVLLVILQAFVRRRTTLLLSQKKQAEQQLHIFLAETLQGIKEIKLSSRESDFLRSFMRAYHLTSYNFSASNNWALLPTQFVMMVGQLGILCFGVGLFLYGIETGALASMMAIVVLVASRVLPAMNRMGTAINGLNNVSSWIETLDETMASLRQVSPSAVIPKEPPQRLRWREISIREASFTYPNADKPALQSTSVRLCKGGSYAFTGPSGAGKSTLVDLILGLLQPSGGSVEVDGMKIDEANRDAWQAGIGYVPQLPMIVDTSLRENIAFGIPREKIDDAKVRQCLALAHLMDILENLPDGMETQLGDRGVRLSGGQKQRVAIARALYSDPDILVLDEATSALDTLSELAIRDALVSLQGKITIISIAHRFSTIRSCDRIFLMEEGRLTAEGSYDTLLRESKLFRELANGSKQPITKEF